MGYGVSKNQEGVIKGKIRYRFDFRINDNRRRKMLQCYPSQVADLYRRWEREQESENPKAKSHKLFEIVDTYLEFISSRQSKQYFKAHQNELLLFKEFLGNLPID